MASSSAADRAYTVVVEHLDPELEEWQALEYRCIADECAASNWNFVLSGLPSAAETQRHLRLPASNVTGQSVEASYRDAGQRQRVCLLDPKAERDLDPADGERFAVFLFGGILGDDPPRDRTGELRKLGFAGRRLGSEQMTTDTAARVTRLVIQDKIRLEEVPYINRPDIKLPAAGAVSADESVSMPFKYVRGQDGSPVMPKGMLELLAHDADKNILDLL